MKNKIREFRARTKMTQDELADKAKVSRQTINAIENDKYDPSLPLAFSLAKAFKVRIEELFVP
ncbi:MAG: helix-turn-helix transcriptional regulator [Candidatus Micrarchaeia archaeon]